MASIQILDLVIDKNPHIKAKGLLCSLTDNKLSLIRGGVAPFVLACVAGFLMSYSSSAK